MLYISAKIGEAVRVGGAVVVLCGLEGNYIRMGIEAPLSMAIIRDGHLSTDDQFQEVKQRALIESDKRAQKRKAAGR